MGDGKKLGVLVRGSGWVAGEHIAAFLKNPHTEVRHIDARTQARTERYFEKFNFKCDSSNDRFEEALERDDIDIVTICTINYQHAREAIAAAKAGKHVFIEKPLAMNLEELRAFEKALKDSGVKSACGFVCHWYPRLVSIKSQIDKGALGQIFFAHAAYLHEVKGEWKAKRATSGSSLLMGGCHAVDLVRWYIGQQKPVAEVHAYASGPFRRKDFDFPPNIFLQMKYADGTLASVGSSLECNMPYAFALELLGTRGSVREEQMYSEDFAGAKAFLTVPGIGPDSADVAHHPFDKMIDEFVEWVRGGPVSSSNSLDAIKTHEIVFAAERSAETGQPVKLPL